MLPSWLWPNKTEDPRSPPFPSHVLLFRGLAAIFQPNLVFVLQLLFLASTPVVPAMTRHTHLVQFFSSICFSGRVPNVGFCLRAVGLLSNVLQSIAQFIHVQSWYLMNEQFFINHLGMVFSEGGSSAIAALRVALYKFWLGHKTAG